MKELPNDKAVTPWKRRLGGIWGTQLEGIDQRTREHRRVLIQWREVYYRRYNGMSSMREYNLPDGSIIETVIYDGW
jgi:hypothetical protein